VAYIVIEDSDISVSSGTVTFSIPNSEIPPDGVYKSELFGFTGAATNLSRTLAQGMIDVKQSLYESDAQFSFPTNVAANYLAKTEDFTAMTGLGGTSGQVLKADGWGGGTWQDETGGPANTLAEVLAAGNDANGQAAVNFSGVGIADGIPTTPIPFHVVDSYNGILGTELRNTSDGVASVVGSIHRVVNNKGYWGGLGMTSTGSTIQAGAMINTMHLYNQGYGDSLYTVDGAEDHVWYTNPNDGHDFGALTNEVMRLESDGSLTVQGSIDGTAVAENGTNILAVAAGALPKSGGTMSGDLDMGSASITNAGVVIGRAAGGVILYGEDQVSSAQALVGVEGSSQGGDLHLYCGTNAAADVIIGAQNALNLLVIDTASISAGVDVDMGGNDIANAAAGTYSGNLTGEVPISLDTAATVVLTAADCRGTIRMNNDDDVIDYTLPDAEVGLVVSIANTIYSQVITVDPQAGDAIIFIDRTVNTTGNAVDSSGAKDDSATFVALSSTQWLMYSAGNTWVDGGAD